jgi:hypothetical protein
MLEKTIVTNIIEYINLSDDSFVIKTHGTPLSASGVPDLIGAWRGVPFAVEVKQPGGRVSLLQRAWLKRFATGGYVAGIVMSIEEFINLEWGA